MTIVYGVFPFCTLAWNRPFASQCRYHESSTSLGLYVFGRSCGVIRVIKNWREFYA